MRPLAVRVPEQLSRHLRLIAKLRGRDLADELRAALQAHVERAVIELASESDEDRGRGGPVEIPTVGQREGGRSVRV